MLRAAPLLALVALTACSSARPTQPPASNRMGPGRAPTPFSAEQIRGAFPDGTWVRLAIETPDEPKTFMVFRFSAGDREGATVTTTLLDVAEAPVAPHTSGRSTWRELQSHASFPEGEVRITPATFDTFRGPLDGWLYEVTQAAEGRLTVTRYAFARELPGPPVLLEATIDGKLVRRLTMVGRGRGEPDES
jgi:hypothetical protein